MSTTGPNVLDRVYRSRVREPRTDDEVTGYWLIVLGLLLGLLGLLVVIGSEINSLRRGLGIAIAGVALLVFVLGTVFRLELERRANYLAILGAVVGLVAVGWFWLVYPTDWQFGSAQVWNVLGLGAAGVALMVIASVIVPLVPDGEPAERGHATPPQEMREGMNEFLADLDITFRRDERTGRPRINKPGSQLDSQQKRDGEYYYST